MANPVWIDKLKARWGVTSAWQVAVILVVFACTGFSVLWLKQFILPLIGITPQTSGWVRFLASVFVILPIYQVVLLAWGFLFGQFQFFWNFEKRMFGRMVGRKYPKS
jgi:hypothetical protein